MPDTHSHFDERAYRDALGRFATGVAIVTAAGPDGSRVGLTISSFNSVSLDPPLVLFSIARTAQSLPVLRATRSLAINVLGRDQKELSSDFARVKADKWSRCEVRGEPWQAPFIEGAIAHFLCEPYAEYEGGDHVIFVVRVISFEAYASRDPLIYFSGDYHALAPSGSKQVQ